MKKKKKKSFKEEFKTTTIYKSRGDFAYISETGSLSR